MLIQACKDAQVWDFVEKQTEGLDTWCGSDGTQLSGGQKQRVAIARAVFANPDIFILDDVLSALDAHVTAHICSNLFNGPLMKGKSVVLVTHSKAALHLSTTVLAIDTEKKIVFTGSYEEFRSSGISAQTLEEQKEEPETVAAVPEAQKDVAAPASKDATTDSKANGANGSTNQQKAPLQRQVSAGEERSTGAVGFAVYKAYAQACGGVLPVCFFLFSIAFSEGSRNATDAYLTYWSNTGTGFAGAGYYACFVLLGGVGALTYVLTRIYTGQRGSKKLHEDCVHALLRAKMTFFDQTPSGAIMNRLAEDTNIMDYNLPQTMGANLVWLWKSTAIVVVCMFINPSLAILIIPMFFIYGRLARRFLPATRDLRRLDAAARSPIFHHFGETLMGMTTIRAMQTQDSMFGGSVQRLTKQQEAYYLSNTAARWLSLRLSCTGMILIAAVCISGVYLATHNAISAGIVGLAMTYGMRLTDTLSQVNRESADRETQMVSVERVVKYVNTVEREADLVTPKDRELPPEWPREGSVELENVCMRYRPELPQILVGVTIKIAARERVGIVGRTGCGKSSLLMTLMRLVEMESGSIRIDGVDTKSIGLHTLRSKAAIIPQDPAILPGTVRYNLDPFSLKSDEELWEALEKAQLLPRIKAAEGGLDGTVEEGGSNFSVGELQLLCLARALLCRQEIGGLLLLDEATSALDAETDQIIQTVIRKDFKCTTITIAHRIQTLLDYDKVLVLHEGQVAEYDDPQKLLKQTNSRFRSLAKDGGVAV